MTAGSVRKHNADVFRQQYEVTTDSIVRLISMKGPGRHNGCFHAILHGHWWGRAGRSVENEKRRKDLGSLRRSVGPSWGEGKLRSTKSAGFRIATLIFRSKLKTWLKWLFAGSCGVTRVHTRVCSDTGY